MPDRLDEVLRHAQDLGLLGPGPVEDQRRHAEAFCRLALARLEGDDGLRWLDLGSGGGLPGLVMAELLEPTGARGTLLDSQQRRGSFLDEAIHRLGMTDRLEAVTARAEDAARDPAHRQRYDLVLARSFASPAVTAECAVAFLKPGARLAVSEPPDEPPGRWDEAQLQALSLLPPTVSHAAGASCAILQRTTDPVDPRWPRKPGIPQKRPLWRSST
jgi:16S rRNA (guanine527-N7)-methyltransferase